MLLRGKKAQVLCLEKKILKMRGLYKGQIVEIPIEQTEVLSTGPQIPNPIMVEESILEEDGRGYAKGVPFEIDGEIQTVPPPAPSRQTPTFINTLPNSSPHYDRLRKKRHALFTTAPLRFEGHPFFKGLPDISKEIKSFYNELFSNEGDIFCESPVVWLVLQLVIINGLLESVQ